MEILMKLKCSPTSPNGVQHSTIKVVDQHHQLQQHTLPQHMRRDSPHSPAGAMLAQGTPPTARAEPQETMLSSCLEYTNTLDCCRTARHDVVNAQTHTHHMLQGSGEFVGLCNGLVSCCAGSTCGTTLPCCSGAMAYGLTPPPPVGPPFLEDTHFTSLLAEEENFPYEYQEPEENFVSIDDAKVKGLLMKIGEETAKNAQQKAQTKVISESVVYEIIELDDEESNQKSKDLENEAASPAETQAQKQTQVATKSPNQISISLIPKSTAPPVVVKSRPSKAETIVAQIDLVDSSDNENDNYLNDANDNEEDDDVDSEDLPLAVAAVSCELSCDEEDDEDLDDGDNEKASESQDSKNYNHPSDGDNTDFIDENEVGQELRWDELEQKGRTLFECFLCGKTVQSNYNLRRHMMIHTGERPFGCDMCVRRFREFSDLKKHRRRHMHESNFLCMICRLHRPTDNDPTRCKSCFAKNEVILADLNPQTNSPPVAAQASPSPSAAKTPASRSMTPTTNTPSPPPPTHDVAQANAAASVATTQSSTKGVVIQFSGDKATVVRRPSYQEYKLGVRARKAFPCPLCNRPFGTRHNLKRHFMIHTGEKPFSCTKCRKPFRECSTLKKHMITHRRDRWYKCLRCPAKYRDYLEYIAHKGTHSQEETTSSASSSAASPMKKAKSQYGAEDSYDSNDEESSVGEWLECCECGQRFTDIETYTEHLKEHDAIFLFECYICKETFEERGKLVKHMEKHEVDGGVQAKRKKDVEVA